MNKSDEYRIQQEQRKAAKQQRIKKRAGWLLIAVAVAAVVASLAVMLSTGQGAVSVDALQGDDVSTALIPSDAPELTSNRTLIARTDKPLTPDIVDRLLRIEQAIERQDRAQESFVLTVYERLDVIEKTVNQIAGERQPAPGETSTHPGESVNDISKTVNNTGNNVDNLSAIDEDAAFMQRIAQIEADNAARMAAAENAAQSASQDATEQSQQAPIPPPVFADTSPAPPRPDASNDVEKINTLEVTHKDIHRPNNVIHRNNNPCALVYGDRAMRYSAESFETVEANGRAHHYATFPTVGHGAAACIDLMAAFHGKTVLEYIAGGDNTDPAVSFSGGQQSLVDFYSDVFPDRGISLDHVINKSARGDLQHMVRAHAHAEGKMQLTDGQLMLAWPIYLNRRIR